MSEPVKSNQSKTMSKFSLLTLATTLTLSVSASQKPNIILIMADDMGFSDIGCYGGEVQTPNLDKLAGHGVRFKQFYNAARCCPTRASLMTGLYPHQTGIGHMTNTPNNPTQHNYGLPGYQGYLNKECVTIAEMLKLSGYQTFMTGKWHLGYHGKEKWPLQRGFDQFYGILSGASNYFKPEAPRGLSLGNESVKPEGEYYTTDAFTDYAIRFIGESTPDKPYFLYLSYTAPHWPLHALQEDIDKYRGKYLNGWTEIRKARLAKMKAIGLLEKDVDLSDQAGPDWDSLSEEQKKEMDLRMAIYAAQIDRMDQNIGRLVEFLETRGDLENTIIFFLSDNGACAEGGMLGGGKAEDLESQRGFLLSYGEAWANVSNTPFKRYKHWVHEGGISTPLIVHWPNGISKDRQGQWIEEYGFLPDIFASIKAVAHADYPRSYQGIQLPDLIGKSIFSAISNNKPIHDGPIFWEHEGNKAVRLGSFKLVSAWDNTNHENWELYDLETDPAELDDLASQQPGKVSQMKKMWGEWAKNHRVEDWENVRQLERDQNRR
tara:strand:+ start:14044 stop:15681 length:1638 start_codon:yes stop_codon:yes gene_type:complete